MASSSNAKKMSHEENKTSLLDLPEQILECILERLSPTDLCNMIRVCSFFRDMCSCCYHLWEKHLTQKWGKIIGDAAYRKWIGDLAYQEWQYCHTARPNLSYWRWRKGLFHSPRNAPQFSAIKPKLEKSCKAGSTLPASMVKALYLALESGKFWFPAQVYHGDTGFTGVVLLCNDAQVSYDYRTDTFRARYPYQVRGTTEENVKWERIRAPPVDTPPFMPHVSDCLHDLKPGDHIEIQWKSHEKCPYGWWYAVVGHLEQCDGNMNHCRCHYSDTIVVEFNQYPPGSMWRRTMLSRKHNPGEGNGVDTLYGGIRKLSDEEEISKWLRLFFRRSYIS